MIEKVMSVFEDLVNEVYKSKTLIKFIISVIHKNFKNLETFITEDDSNNSYSQ